MEHWRLGHDDNLLSGKCLNLFCYEILPPFSLDSLGAFFFAATHFKRARLTFTVIKQAVFTGAIFHRIAFEAVYYSGIAFQGALPPF